MITKLQALGIITVIAVEAGRVLNSSDDGLSQETRNIVGAMLVSVGTILNELDNEGFFDE